MDLVCRLHFGTLQSFSCREVAHHTRVPEVWEIEDENPNSSFPHLANFGLPRERALARTRTTLCSVISGNEFLFATWRRVEEAGPGLSLQAARLPHGLALEGGVGS